MSKPRLLFVRGDTEGALGSIKFYWPLFYIARLAENPDYSPTTIVTPTLEEAVEALTAADAAIFYGHGNPGVVWLQARRKEGLRTKDVQRIAELRRVQGKPMMRFVHVACCQTCRDSEWVDAWLEVTETLRGYEVDTYDPRKPFSIPECRTYRKASHSGSEMPIK